MAVVKTVQGLALASMKTRNGLAAASVKTINGLDSAAGGGSPFGGLVSTTDLVDWWPLDEASGNRFGVHAGLELTDVGTVTAATGPDGSPASQFTAANNEYLNRTSEAALQVGDIDFEFAVWVYIDAMPGAFFRILSKRLNATNSHEYDLYVRNDTGALVLDLRTAAGTLFGVTSSATMSIGTWYLAHAWHDSGSDLLGVQIDENAATTAATSGNSPTTASSDFRVGNLQQVSRPWNGAMQRLGFFKRLLTAGERTALYNSGNGLDY